MVSLERRDTWTAMLCDSLEKVFPDQKPRALNTDIPLVAFRGERASFQVAVLPPALAHAVTLGDVLVELVPPQGVRAELSRVELVPVSLAAFEDADEHYLRRAPGLFPDLLRPSPQGVFSPVVGQWRAAWVDLHVDAGAPAGEVELGVSVRAVASGDTFAEYRVPILIPEAALPALDIPHTEWFHCDGLADYYGHEPFSEENWVVIDRFIASAARAQANTILTPTWTPPLDTAVGGSRTATQLLGIRDGGGGRYEFDFAALRRWMQICRDNGIRYLEIAHFFTQWGALATPAIYVDTASGLEQRFGWHVPANDPRYRAFLEQLIPELCSVLDAEWGLERVFFHVSDEPTLEQAESYGAAHALVGDLLQGCTVLDALSDLAFYESGAVQLPAVATDHAAAFLDAGVSPMWLYYCVSQNREVSNRFMATPSVRNRVLGTQLFLTGAAGFLHWGFNFYNSFLSQRPINPFHDTCAGAAFIGGDSFLVYPGDDGEPWESIRHRVTAEAFLDYRALRLLASTDAATARRLADHDGTLRLDSFSYDADHYRRVLWQLANAIDSGTSH